MPLDEMAPVCAVLYIYEVRTGGWRGFRDLFRGLLGVGRFLPAGGRSPHGRGLPLDLPAADAVLLLC